MRAYDEVATAGFSTIGTFTSIGSGAANSSVVTTVALLFCVRELDVAAGCEPDEDALGAEATGAGAGAGVGAGTTTSTGLHSVNNTVRTKQRTFPNKEPSALVGRG